MEVKKAFLDVIKIAEITKLKQDLASTISKIHELETESEKIADRILNLTLSNSEILNEQQWDIDRTNYTLIHVQTNMLF